MAKLKTVIILGSVSVAVGISIYLLSRQTAPPDKGGSMPSKGIVADKRTRQKACDWVNNYEYNNYIRDYLEGNDYSEVPYIIAHILCNKHFIWEKYNCQGPKVDKMKNLFARIKPNCGKCESWLMFDKTNCKVVM